MLARPSLVATLLPLLLLLSGCTGLAGLDGGGDAPALAVEERGHVRAQVEKALAEQRFKTAWNQEVAAGAERARLEEIALAALAAQSAHASDMFAALRAKHGALGADARARVEALAAEAQRGGAWSRALDIRLATTDEPDRLPRAWALYRAAPPELAPGLLETIQEAKEEAAKAKESGD